MNIIADTHLHSSFSCDAKDSIEDLVQQAIRNRLTYLCLTEHIDYNPLDYGYDFFKYEEYSQEIDRMRDKYSGDITILKGLEFSEPHLYKAEFALECARDYDMMMAGLHWLDDHFYGEKRLLDKYSPQQIMDHYLADLAQVVEIPGIDVIAHFDFPHRYFGAIDSRNRRIKNVLTKIADKGMALEINTSGFRKGYPHTLPGFEILEQYRECGGRRVTIGSDAHQKEHIGADFDKAYSLLKTFNLEYGLFINKRWVPLNFY